MDRCLERWLESGVLEIDDGGSAGIPAVEKPEPHASRGAGAPLRVDPELELDVEIQQQVIDFLARLDRPYHEVLGVARDADARTLKKAYFGLSRVYHPDRYFRRRLGPFGPAVERCFKRLLEAYELLSDPATREEVQRGERQRQQEAAAAAKTDEATRLRLRKRLDQLSGQGRLRAERRRKAKGFFEAGMAAFAKERWLEAAGSVRLSIAFDPENAAFRERFADVQRRAHEERAKQLR